MLFIWQLTIFKLKNKSRFSEDRFLFRKDYCKVGEGRAVKIGRTLLPIRSASMSNDLTKRVLFHREK